MLRQVIVTMMGNVDAGKSQTIDMIKNTSIVKSEPGKITQTIKAYNVSIEVIKKIVGGLDTSKIKLPGLLFVDTPGHASFNNLRKRGGALADIAVLVVDINEGIKPQTKESMEILKETKTPFVIALNKIDLIPGWSCHNNKALLENISSQTSSVQESLETKLYDLVGKFFGNGFTVDRFDRIQDYTQIVAAIPLSAKTGEGVPELLMVLTGLAQRFLEDSLKCDVDGPAKGTVLEVIEEKGLGKTFDTIIYDGVIKKGDQIVVGTLEQPLITKVKAIFTTENNKLKPIDEAHAAIGVKLSCSESKGVISGMPILVANENVDKAIENIIEQVEETTFDLDEDGIVIKADSIGSLEALLGTLKEKGFNVKRASVGDISKKDIAEADSSNDKLNRVILGFRINPFESEKVSVICSNVIYTLIENFEKWRAEKQSEIDVEVWKGVKRPFKIKILVGCIFRQSNPAVVGIEILSGTVKAGINVFKDDKALAELKSIQKDGKTISEAKEGDEIAASFPGVTAGRQIKEGDILYSELTEEEFRKFKELKKYLNDGEVQLLKEIAEIKRKNNSVWGIG